MDKIAVLGTGPSLKLFMPEEFDLTIGVNDIWRFHKTDVVVCLDHAKVFRGERLKTLNECKPKHFFSQIVNWDFKEGFRKLDFKHTYPDAIVRLRTPSYEKSFCSPFVAVQVAWRSFDADEIHLFGVDMDNHPHFDAKLRARMKIHFRLLKEALKKEGCEMIVHGDGILKDL